MKSAAEIEKLKNALIAAYQHALTHSCTGEIPTASISGYSCGFCVEQWQSGGFA
jgi:hypothetical protein